MNRRNCCRWNVYLVIVLLQWQQFGSSMFCGGVAQMLIWHTWSDLYSIWTHQQTQAKNRGILHVFLLENGNKSWRECPGSDSKFPPFKTQCYALIICWRRLCLHCFILFWLWNWKLALETALQVTQILNSNTWAFLQVVPLPTISAGLSGLHVCKHEERSCTSALALPPAELQRHSDAKKHTSIIPCTLLTVTREVSRISSWPSLQPSIILPVTFENVSPLYRIQNMLTTMSEPFEVGINSFLLKKNALFNWYFVGKEPERL